MNHLASTSFLLVAIVVVVVVVVVGQKPARIGDDGKPLLNRSRQSYL